MTFDLHLSSDLKSDEYELWVKRIYAVSSTLNISYETLWNIPEYEFLILENISKETIDKRQQRQQELLNQNG